VERRVADDEAAGWVDPASVRLGRALDRAPRQLGTVGRVRAEAAEAEVPVEPGTAELDACGRLDAAGRQAEQVAGLGEPREQLADAGEHAVALRLRDRPGQVREAALQHPLELAVPRLPAERVDERAEPDLGIGHPG